MGSLSYLLVLVLFMMFVASDAKQFLVGGDVGGWKVPSSPSESPNNWAQKKHFKVNDVLVFSYDNKSDSVLEVPKKQYEGCIKDQEIISVHGSGETKFKLNRTGSFYFLSGVDDHCEKGLKLEVVVLDNQAKPPMSPETAPAPEPVNPMAPAPAKDEHNGAFGLKAGFVGVLMGLSVLAGMF